MLYKHTKNLLRIFKTSKIPIFGENNATHFQELIYQTSKARTYYFTKVAKIKSSKSKSKLHAYKA